MDRDDYSEIINGDRTYANIAKRLLEHGSCVIGWTDQDVTHLDILMVLKPQQSGRLQRGQGHTDLFVGITGFGCHGFSVDATDTHASYIGEKLNLGSHANPTTNGVADLLNNVRLKLKEQAPTTQRTPWR